MKKEFKLMSTNQTEGISKSVTISLLDDNRIKAVSSLTDFSVIGNAEQVASVLIIFMGFPLRPNFFNANIIDKNDFFEYLEFKEFI